MLHNRLITYYYYIHIILIPIDFFAPLEGEDPILCDIEFTESDVEQACLELSTSSVAGADGVAWLLPS